MSVEVQAIVDALSAPVAVVSAAGEIALTNEAWKRRPPDEWLSPRFASAAARGLEDVLAGRRKTFMLEYPAEVEGEERWFAMRIAVIDGAAGGALIRHLDITDRKRTERSLLESEQRFRAIFEMSLDGILLGDDDGVVLDANAAACALLGRPRGDIVRRQGWTLFDREGDVGDAKWRAFLELGELQGELIAPGPDGRRIEFEFAARARVLPGVHMMTFRDITRRKQLEQQVLQGQKMETVGRLAGGVAHDFNNLLTAILGYSDLLIEDDQDEATRKYNAIEIRTAALRASVLTRQLLTFSRHESARPQHVDLNAVITAMHRLLSRMIGEQMILSTRLSPELPRVLADLGQMEQVIANLAVNARDAMPEGGEITFSTAVVDVDERVSPAAGAASAGRYVEVAVADRGHGIPPDVLPHIFEPFFTTKDQGKGTGLGLSTVYGIVTGSGGHITVESEVGTGTVIRIRLPIATEPM